MNNMGLFSKSDKDKKDKSRDITIPIYNGIYECGANILIKAEIHNFKNLSDFILSIPENKEALNYLKEKFGEYIDGKELEKVLLLYVFGLALIDVLEGAAKYLSEFSTLNSFGYYLYRDENILGGKLDERIFRELILTLNEYSKSKASNEKDKQNKKQKDEQPK